PRAGHRAGDPHAARRRPGPPLVTSTPTPARPARSTRTTKVTTACRHDRPPPATRPVTKPCDETTQPPATTVRRRAPHQPPPPPRCGGARTATPRSPHPHPPAGPLVLTSLPHPEPGAPPATTVAPRPHPQHQRISLRHTLLREDLPTPPPGCVIVRCARFLCP